MSVDNNLSHYRHDIDFLRGVSVLLVLLFHSLANILPSGFIGVDVFFLVSGYLAAQSLTNPQVSSNSFFSSQMNFYKNRFQKIAPGLCFMIFFVSVISYPVLSTVELTELLRTGVLGALFVSNLFVPKNFDYFQSWKNLGIFTHLWSLSIEAQFYLIIPFFFYLKKYRFHTLLFTTLSSLLYALFLSQTNSNEAYISLACRIFELFVGVQLFFLKNSPSCKKINTFINVYFLDWVALFLIISLSFFKIDLHYFPAPIGLIPIFCSVIFLLNDSISKQKICSEKFSLVSKIGKHCYLIYLFAWPIFSFLILSEMFEDMNPIYLRVVFALISLLVSYYIALLMESFLREKKKAYTLSKHGLVILCFVLALKLPTSIYKNKYTEIFNDALVEKLQKEVFDHPPVKAHSDIIVYGDSLAHEFTLILDKKEQYPMYKQNDYFCQNFSFLKKHFSLNMEYENKCLARFNELLESSDLKKAKILIYAQALWGGDINRDDKVYENEFSQALQKIRQVNPSIQIYLVGLKPQFSVRDLPITEFVSTCNLYSDLNKCFRKRFKSLSAHNEFLKDWASKYHLGFINIESVVNNPKFQMVEGNQIAFYDNFHLSMYGIDQAGKLLDEFK